MKATGMLRKPEWIRARVPSGDEWKRVDAILNRRHLHTVCDEARCPNKAECWGRGTATFMIMGDICTRNCRFCAVATAKSGRVLRSDEPESLAEAVVELRLRYAVLTSVDRDDLPDRGAAHFASCVGAIKSVAPDVKVEVLIPDYQEGELELIAGARPDVVAHNVETVRRLQGVRDGRASFDKSLETLILAKRYGFFTKSSILLGLGETRDEVLSTMNELRGIGVDALVLGQYLQPSSKQIPVSRYIEPGEFDDYAAEARGRGFGAVVSGPFARTSYHAMDAWEARNKGDEKVGEAVSGGGE